MRKLFPVLVFIAACAEAPADMSEQAEQAILAADRTMSEQATREGFNKTLLLYADSAVVKFNEGQYPIIGKNALTQLWQGQADTKRLSWEPFKAEAARSGDMGYTLGYWTYAAPDTTLYGNYYTVWKKQADGSWKFVLDGGNGVPGPPQKE